MNDSPLQNNRTVPAAHVVSNLGGVAFIVQEEKVDFPHVADQELLETVRQDMTSLLVAAVANLE